MISKVTVWICATACVAFGGCTSSDAKKDPASTRQPGTGEPGDPRPTLESENQRLKDWAAFLDTKFEQDGPPDASAQAVEAQMRTKATDAKAKMSGATINIDGPSCRAKFCRAMVTFGSLAEREQHRPAFGVMPPAAFTGQWTVGDFVISDTQVNYYISLKGGELPTPPQ